MRGIPLFRLLVLALFLGGAVALVAKVAGPDPGDPPANPTAQPPPSRSQKIPVFLEAVLSAPAESVVFANPNSSPPSRDVHRPPALTFDHDLALTLTTDGRSKDLVTVRWTKPGQSNFLLLTLEPDGLETKSVTLHFPPNVTTVPLNLHWPEAASALPAP